MAYKQLTQEQRYQIAAFMKAGFNQKQIALEIQVHPATISRELRRNRGLRGYRPRQAQLLADNRKLAKQKKRICARTWRKIESHLSEQWSPEQITGYLKRHNQETVSPEWIYQYIYRDKKAGGSLFKNLRCQKKRRKRYGKNSRRGQIPNRRMIRERPAVVTERRRTGDWEADTIIGKRHRHAIVTFVERKTGYCLIKPIKRKTAPEVKEAALELLAPVKEQVHTITSDNGREFAGHEEIAARLEADFYFANAYHSWERGSNENLNGLVRQYFPKKMDFANLTDCQVRVAQDKLNNRPRKRLGYRTPNELFFKEQKIALTN